MDRPMYHPDVDGQGRSAGHQERLVLPSRKLALDLVRSALEAGPILLTGEAGTGKTWLWQHLAEIAAPARSWVEVDLTPADDPASFLRMVGHGLGLNGAVCSRLDLANSLAERHAEGDRRVLVIEEAHNLSPEVAEEVRVLTNRLGRKDGFAGMVLVGQTSLAFRMSSRPLAAIETRLAARVHLGPIDADEARDLMAWHRPSTPRSLDEVERAHRDSGGNPRRLLRVMPLAATPALGEFRPTAISPRTPAGLAAPAEAMASVKPAPEPKPVAIRRHPEPLTGPDRPPLHVEDESIEVGWSPEDAEESVSEDDSPMVDGMASGPAIAGREEAVHDHYAALQAWREWADNQGRRVAPEVPTPVATSIPAPTQFRQAPTEPLDDEDYDPDPDPDAANPNVWVDGQHEFAPFGQLFSKMARIREPE